MKEVKKKKANISHDSTYMLNLKYERTIHIDEKETDQQT